MTDEQLISYRYGAFFVICCTRSGSISSRRFTTSISISRTCKGFGRDVANLPGPGAGAAAAAATVPFTSRRR